MVLVAVAIDEAREEVSEEATETGLRANLSFVVLLAQKLRS